MRLCVAFGSVSALVAAAPALAAPIYTITTFGPFSGGYNAVAFALNASGEVTGRSETAAYSAGYDAYLYDGKTQRDLGTLGTGAAFSVGYGVNSAGEVVGYSRKAAGGSYYAFLYTGGTMTPLNVFGAESYGMAVNDNDQITGNFAASANYHAFVTAGGAGGGAVTDIGLLPKYDSTVGNAINASGVVVGQAYNQFTSAERAIMYANGKLTDLGTLGGKYATAQSINASGEIVGSALVSSGLSHAFARGASATTLTDLGTLGGATSIAQGVNDAGEIVGTSDTAAANTFHAFVDTGGVMTDLNSLIDPAYGLVADHAYKVNNAGQIVGDGIYQGQTVGYLLTPVPEPATAAVAALAAGGLLARRRRRA